MTFSQLQIGDVFYHASSPTTAALFEKKSKSSAYTLHPVTLERAKLPAYAREICGFYGGVKVFPIAEGL